MSHVVVSQVTKSYPGRGGRSQPVPALNDVSFEIRHNEFCSILGHSGCGKTTLLNMIGGFERPTRGTIMIDGEQITNPHWSRTVIFQDYALFPWMTVAENISFGLEMKKIPRDERRDRVRRHIELVGLGGTEGRFPHELSGGMKQRVSIARALAVDPKVLLMDEPFAALDAQNRGSMQREMVRIWERERKTVVLVTHSIEEAVVLSDRILVMTRHPGRVKADLEIGLARPRREEDPQVIALRNELRDLIHESELQA
ncbi:MAG: ABC transporter ATP-binding protein [Burkholderiales bacterium]|nr:ABC transporter ATP-binding protein [Burkholderiales bacterium]OJX08359.1 MAG: nitrate ABC transporter ATP-binding protein [Burkholderiales bacterium 70-64]